MDTLELGSPALHVCTAGLFALSRRQLTIEQDALIKCGKEDTACKYYNSNTPELSK